MSRKGLNIYKRKDGRWEARYIKSRNALGKPKYGYLYASSYREVRCDLQHTLQLQGKPSGSEERTRNSTFELVSMEWLDAFSINFKESTYIRYRTLIECYLMPSFQTVKIEKITKEMVRKLCKHLELHGKKDKTGLSPKTISDVLSVLRRILNYAGTIGISVDSKVLDIRVKQTQKSLPILSLPEQMILQQYLEEHPDALNLGILLCLLTGIRIGELCALTWEKISISERNIYICQTMQRIQNRVPGSKKTHIEIASPKSSSANRNIPISNLLFGFLERYSLSHTGFFLSGSPSKFIEPRCIQRRFHKILDACGLEKRNFHILRHTFATRCVEAKIDIKTLSEILGLVGEGCQHSVRKGWKKVAEKAADSAASKVVEKSGLTGEAAGIANSMAQEALRKGLGSAGSGQGTESSGTVTAPTYDPSQDSGESDDFDWSQIQSEFDSLKDEFPS